MAELERIQKLWEIGKPSPSNCDSLAYSITDTHQLITGMYVFSIVHVFYHFII